MSFLVRKINKAKWLQIDIQNDSDASADAITSDLRTANNTLSVWRINSFEELNEAVLAIASGLDHLETIDIVIFSDEFFNVNNFQVVETPGLTPIEELKNKHADISNLNHSKLGIVSRQIIADLKNNQSRRYIRGQLKTILLEALQNNRLTLEQLSESLVAKLK